MHIIGKPRQGNLLPVNYCKPIRTSAIIQEGERSGEGEPIRGNTPYGLPLSGRYRITDLGLLPSDGPTMPSCSI